MAPAGHLIAAQKKATRLLDFVTELKPMLTETNKKVSTRIIADIDHYIYITQVFKRYHAALDKKSAAQLETQGKSLWNICIRARRLQHTNSTTSAPVYCKIRLFSYQLIDIGISYSLKEPIPGSPLTYLLQLAISLGKTCIADDDIETASAAMPIAAEKLQKLQDAQRVDATIKPKIDVLHLEYLTLRIGLSWKENRLDVADHWFAKIETLSMPAEFTIGHLVDMLHHIAVSLASKSNIEAIKWHQRAYKQLKSRELTEETRYEKGLKIAVWQTFIQCLLSSPDIKHLQQATKLVTELVSDIGEKPYTLHWQLEILRKAHREVPIQQYIEVLKRIINLNDGSEEVFNCTLHHLRILFQYSADDATTILDEFITKSLLYFEKPKLLSKALLQRIWISSQGLDPHHPVVGHLLDIVHSQGHAIEAETVGSIQLIIWEKVISLYTAKQYELVTKWCQIASHPIFRNGSDTNQAIFGRKQMICALTTGNPERAIQAFKDMPHGAQNETLSQYLLFRAALRTWNQEAVRQSLDMITIGTNKDEVRAVLYACIREAQEVGDKLCTLTALKAIAQDAYQNQETPSNLPIILRCAIRLMNIIENTHPETADVDGAVANDLCSMFEIATKQCQGATEIFTNQELHWFCKNAYNIGVSKCDSWDLQHIIRVFSCCAQLCMVSISISSMPDQAELHLMAARCEFVMVLAYASMARVEREVSKKTQYYEDVYSHALAFYEIDVDATLHQPQATADILSKRGLVSIFNVEAAVFLEKWDMLPSIIHRAKKCTNEDKYSAMMDCILRSNAPEEVAYDVCSSILDEMILIDAVDRGKVAKYIRHVFQIILPIDETAAFGLIDRVIDLKSGQTECTWGTEIEWLAASSFNHAIDLYARQDQRTCHEWAMKAVRLAELVQDDGILVDTLQTKLAKLQLQ